MKIESPAFLHHQMIPSKYTCEGENVSPPLVLSDVPDGTKSIALIMDDPDAPMGTFDHWIAWNIEPQIQLIEEGVTGMLQGINGFSEVNYRGPCPPPGNPHRYFFKCYALDIVLDLPKGSTKESVEESIEGHILSRAELIGIFSRR